MVTTRRVLVGIVIVAVVVASVEVWRLGRPWREGERRGPWRSVFNGYGSVDHEDGDVVLAPKAPVAADDTHAALVVTTERYRDLAATVRVRTERQMRPGGANVWEVGWVLWHYTTPRNFYALALKPSGWELSKQDPDYPGGQRFLATGSTPTFPVGTWHTVGVVQVGTQIDVSADGRLLTRLHDSSKPYLAGAFGLYSEDARVRFSDVEITRVPAPSPDVAGAGP